MFASNVFQLEKETSGAKITKLKLQAKAKLTTLNKQIEELKKTATNQVYAFLIFTCMSEQTFKICSIFFVFCFFLTFISCF